VKSAAPRLLALLAGLFLLAYASFNAVRSTNYLTPGQSGLALGMAWLQHEYQLDDDTFQKITLAHSQYLRECRQRCHELEDVNQHFLSALRQDGTAIDSDLDAVQILQESICHDCRIAMIQHVHDVADLMPEATGLQFIEDVQKALAPSQRKPRRTFR
jgi:hypothetical protein